MKNLIISAVLTLGSFAAFGAQTSVDECLAKATSNVAMKQCVYAEYASQDKVLNAEYKKLMNALQKDQSSEGKEIVNRVIKNQRAWIAMRDTSCAIEGIDMLGGTGEGLIIGDCLGRMTKERVVKIIEMQKTLGGISADDSKQQ